MNLFTAIHDPIFRTYAAITAAVLILGGFLLAILGRSAKKPLGSVLATYRGWLIMAPTVLIAVALGRTVFIVFVTLLSLKAFSEFARATGLARDLVITAFIAIAIGVVG